MKKALDQALIAFDQGEVPVGAVIVHRDRVIAEAYNQREMLQDPTAHAEMIAMTQAAGAAVMASAGLYAVCHSGALSDVCGCDRAGPYSDCCLWHSGSQGRGLPQSVQHYR